MTTKLIALTSIPESVVEFNRERVKNEFSQGIYDLMRLHGVKQSRLAELLGVERSRISHMLSGGRNFRLDTLADVFLVLGRTPHLVLGTDFEEIRFPHDEGDCMNGSRTVTETPVPKPSQMKNYLVSQDTISVIEAPTVYAFSAQG